MTALPAPSRAGSSTTRSGRADAVLDQVGRDGGPLHPELRDAPARCTRRPRRPGGHARRPAPNPSRPRRPPSTPRRARRRRRGRRRSSPGPASRAARTARASASAAPTWTCQNTPAETRKVTLDTLVWTAPDRCCGRPLTTSRADDRRQLTGRWLFAARVDAISDSPVSGRHNDLEFVDPGPVRRRRSRSP